MIERPPKIGSSGLLANLSAMLLSSSIGRWVDRHPSRLRTLQSTILIQRTSICLACVGWALLLRGRSDVSGYVQDHTESDEPTGRNSRRKTAMMTCLVILGMVERLSAIGNTLVMERDWVHTYFLSSTVQ